MVGFGKKKTALEEEDLCCRFCEYAGTEQDEGQVFCKKKKKTVESDGNCLSFAYDLLKRRPAKKKEVCFADLEFPEI